MESYASVAHLLRRAGFGATKSEVAAAAAAGYGATVSRLVSGLGGTDAGADAVPAPSLSPPPSDYGKLARDPAARDALAKTLGAERQALTDWWLSRLVATTNPLAEKLTFLFHGQFPTAISKVRFPIYMYRQNQLFRTLGPGRFDDLTLAVSTDPAMMIWLDTVSDKSGHPNENFARELMERFTMGIGNYTEADVRAGAVCFTGWSFNRASGAFAIVARAHDDTPQTFLSVPGVNSGTQVVDIVTHSAASIRYVPARLWSHLAYPVATADPVVSDLAAGYGSDLNVTNLLRAIFEHPAFTSTAATTGLVKQPTEYVVGALRALGIGAPGIARQSHQIQATMAGLGQILFDPPSVGGWPQNEYWLSTAAALTRWRFAQALAQVGDISPVADVAPAARADAAAELLAVPGWTAATASALRQVAANPRAVVTLALASPEYVSN